MANCPNLMMSGESEYFFDIGKFKDIFKTNSKKAFISKRAHEVYFEYQKQLFTDNEITQSDADHYCAVLGEIAIVFVHLYTNDIFYKEAISMNNVLGDRQWNDLNFWLKKEGQLSHVKHLFFVCHVLTKKIDQFLISAIISTKNFRLNKILSFENILEKQQ
ncbi:hypothetical protein MHBO_000778 [Bonamia ostreae]|uniref:Uncharacterized protein n=1 Tax=Bonamia ostreae TaxID=126728 RepID=A0ABV2AGU1_9EUKA